MKKTWNSAKNAREKCEDMGLRGTCAGSIERLGNLWRNALWRCECIKERRQNLGGMLEVAPLEPWIAVNLCGAVVARGGREVEGAGSRGRLKMKQGALKT